MNYEKILVILDSMFDVLYSFFFADLDWASGPYAFSKGNCRFISG